jgi:hypothetical protein
LFFRETSVFSRKSHTRRRTFELMFSSFRCPHALVSFPDPLLQPRSFYTGRRFKQSCARQSKDFLCFVYFAGLWLCWGGRIALGLFSKVLLSFASHGKRANIHSATMNSATEQRNLVKITNQAKAKNVLSSTKQLSAKVSQFNLFRC